MKWIRRINTLLFGPHKKSGELLRAVLARLSGGTLGGKKIPLEPELAGGTVAGTARTVVSYAYCILTVSIRSMDF